MHIDPILILALIGAIAGYLATMLVKGYGFGLLGNVTVGVVGAWLAAWALPNFGLTFGSTLLAQIISATVGAVLLLFLIGVVRRAMRRAA